MQSQVAPSGTTLYPLADALGSVRALTDGSGAATMTADYGVFGDARATTGTTSTFGFTGEQQDAATGLTYLRARYYDPTLGRFLSADTVQPNAPGTQGYNRYAYVANNPTTWTDPTGHIAGGAAAGGGAAGNILRSIILSPYWLPISLLLVAIFLADCAAQSPLGLCSAIAAFAITVFVIVACVLEVGGPCWTAGPLPQTKTRTDTKAGEKTKPIDIAPPMQTPPRGPNCIDNPWPGGGKAPEWRWEFPPVSDAELDRALTQLYRPTDQRPGGTPDEIRREGPGGKHAIKGKERSSQLRRILRSGRLNDHDRAIAKWVLQELQNALNGCPK